MTGKQILWAIAWFLVLIFLAWPIGFFCAGWYVCLCPFEACIDGMKSITALLMKGVSLPFGVAHRMVKGKSYSSIWWAPPLLWTDTIFKWISNDRNIAWFYRICNYSSLPSRRLYKIINPFRCEAWSSKRRLNAQTILYSNKRQIFVALTGWSINKHCKSLTKVRSAFLSLWSNWV